MRVSSRGVARTGAPFQLTFEGQPVDAWSGESLAAALVSAGIWGLRKTRDGAERGIFCGMGVCGECAVLVDGEQRRACLEPARPGVTVRRMPALAPAAILARPERQSPRTLAPDVMILGAGPAGLAAARIAAEAGLDTLVVDERAKPGGQYLKQPGAGFTIDPAAIDRQFAAGIEAFEAASAAGAEFLLGATLWSAGDGPEFGVVQGGRQLTILPRRAILSPGAYERPHMVPGWTLPGVMTTGAAQTLLRAYQTTPGRRVLVAGNGPLNLQVAAELSAAGAEIVALAEAAASPWSTNPVDLLRLAIAGPDLIAEGARHLATLRKAGVRPAHRHVLVRVDGGDKAERATIARIDAEGKPIPGSEVAYDIDSVCMGYGFLAQSEIARASGCAHRIDPARGPIVIRDDDGRSSVHAIFIAGDAGGLGGARIAKAQGIIAALAIAADLGFRPRDATRERKAAAKALDRNRRFQDALWRIYAADVEDGAGSMICRCEQVDRASIAGLIINDHASVGALKRMSRAGMGRCQGRYCSGAILKMLGTSSAQISPESLAAPRFPFKPIPINALADSSPREL